MADVHLPTTLMPLFPGIERRVDVDADTVDEMIAKLDAQWPGLRDRLCVPGPEIRMHIHVYVNQQRAQLDTPIDGRSRVDVIAAISGG